LIGAEERQRQESQMDDLSGAPMSRRRFLRLAAAVPPALILAACGLDGPDEEAATSIPASAATTQPTAAAIAAAPTLAPTPACGDDDDAPTPAQTEGPFYTPDTPERSSLREAGLAGVPLVVSGAVLATNCQPISGALLDFWHCDDAGQYDNSGFRLRGHQFADDQGRFTLESIMPGLYPGRTRHIHVKVQAPNQPVLTTQLYFPGEEGNARDGIFDPALLMDVTDTGAGKSARFDFVLDVS
jgi:protocatechuate 3,4-dioxygenase beta subunit